MCKSPTEPSPSITTLSSTLFHCGLLFRLADEASTRCESAVSTGAETPLTRDAIAAILLSSSAAEAFINELAEEASAHENNTRPDEDACIRLLAWMLQKLEDARVKTTDKFECAARILSGQNPDLGRAPFQDAAMLFSLRNEIMHVKRKSVIEYLGNAASSPIPKGVKTLLDWKLARESLLDRQTHWIFSLMTPGVARWACSTSTALCDHIRILVPNAVLSDTLHVLLEMVFEANRVYAKQSA
jgi:hypothetical protein